MIFRVFNKKEKKYHYIDLTHGHYAMGFILNHDGTAQEEDFGPWQMSTGLVDSQGVDIFQGDKLDHSYDEFPDDDKNAYEVVFQDGCFRKSFKDWPKSLPMTVLSSTEISILNDTIIGNINQ